MSASRLFPSLAETRLAARPVHLAIGIFDGVHLGHQAVIEAAVHSARRAAGLAGVLTFQPHPSRVLRPQDPTRLLMPPVVKRTVILERLGADFLIEEPFTPALAAIAAEDFLPHLQHHLPGLAAVYVGANWRFGRGRGGDVALLVAEGRKHGVQVFSAPRVELDGEPISSTRIRALLAAGNIAQANALLGYTYFCTGAVTPGQRLGHRLGFPTLNVPWAPEFPPARGVYVVNAGPVSGGPARPGVANYGVRPTFGPDGPLLLEVHLLGDCPFGPGDELCVEWLHFLRPERRFAAAEELRAQIAADREAARAWHARFQAS